MSDNVIKNAQAIARTMASQKTLLDRENPKSIEMHQYMANLKRALTGEVEVPGTKKLVPRFGALSLLAMTGLQWLLAKRQTPWPEMKKP